MGELEAVIYASNGVVSSRQLYGIGLSRADVARLVRRGRLVSLRRRWFAAPSADERVVQAIRFGGVLSCVSVLEQFGVWRPPGVGGLHVRFTRREKVSGGVQSHILPREIGEPLVRASDSGLKSVLCALTCLPADDAVAVLDSARQRRLVLDDDLHELRRWTSSAGRRVIVRSDGLAESGVETVMRLLLTRLRVQFQAQVVIAGVGRVDFLLGDRLIIEVDGEAYHADSVQFQRDRERDRMLHALGFTVLRFTYRDVMGDLDAVEQLLIGKVRADAHKWTRANCLWRRAGRADPVVRCA